MADTNTTVGHYQDSYDYDEEFGAKIWPGRRNIDADKFVQQPPHYNKGDIECVDAIQASMSKEEFEGYLKGNVLKYIWRYKYKGKAEEDLEKASVYMGWLKEFYATGKITKTKTS